MIRVQVLGPTELLVDSESRPLGGGIPRALIVLLALAQGRTVSDDVLIDTAWSGKPPASGAHALTVYISTLRKLVAPEATIVRSGQGFALSSAEGLPIRVDAAELTELGDAAREAIGRTDLATAGEVADRALALWRGRPFADLPESEEWNVEAARLEALHGELRQIRAECRVAAGDVSAVAELRAFAEQDPYDEATHMRLMRALYVMGRQQDALDVFAGFARRVRDELGLEPSAAMVALERAVLNHRLGAGGTGRPRRSQPVFGRDQLVAEVAELLAAKTRVATLVGMGGIGKTTVAIPIADRAANDGQLITWIAGEELASGDVPTRIAQEITGLRNVDPYDITVEHDRPRLLVIDGFEGHESEAPYLDYLAGALPSARILITSRRPSRVSAEWIVQVPPLDSTDADALFADVVGRRARGALEEEGAVATAAAICQRLAGIPLALELAAARVGVLSVDELAETLDIASLAGVLESTVGLLSETARQALIAVGVLRSPFTVVDVAAVADLPEAQVESSLRELYDAGLIVRNREWTGPTRFTLLDPIREYAVEALRVGGLEQAVRDRHLERLVTTTQVLAEEFAVPESQLQAVERFDATRADYAAALDYAISEGRTTIAVDLITTANVFWHRLSPREALALCDRVNRLELGQDDWVRLNRIRRGMLHHAGRIDEALEISEEITASGAAVRRDRELEVTIRTSIGDPTTALQIIEGVIPEVRELGTTHELIQIICYRTQAHLIAGEYEAALTDADEVDALIATHGATPLVRAYARIFQAEAVVMAGDTRRAAALMHESLTNGSDLRDTNARPSALLLVADLALGRGDEERGRAIAATALAVYAGAGIGIAPVQATCVPGARVSTLDLGPAELTLAEAVELAYTVLDEILAES